MLVANFAPYIQIWKKIQKGRFSFFSVIFVRYMWNFSRTRLGFEPLLRHSFYVFIGIFKNFQCALGRTSAFWNARRGFEIQSSPIIFYHLHYVSDNRFSHSTISQTGSSWIKAFYKPIFPGFQTFEHRSMLYVSYVRFSLGFLDEIISVLQNSPLCHLIPNWHNFLFFLKKLKTLFDLW